MTFGEDLAFLRKHTDVVLLRDKAGAAQVAVVPAYQGRVMTSTAGGAKGSSFGWVNRELLGLKLPSEVRAVGFESMNAVRNTGNAPWRKETGLLSIWILGRMNASATHVHRTLHLQGPEEQLDPIARTALGIGLGAIKTALRR